LVVYEVAPDATHREDPRVYRADIVGIRHPDAEFIAHSRRDIASLLAALEAVLALAAKHEHGALRWLDPLPVPEWIQQVRDTITTALGGHSDD
jgi:hypothetical protein